MEAIFKAGLLVGALLLFTSCDPALVLEFANNTDAQASATIYFLPEEANDLNNSGMAQDSVDYLPNTSRASYAFENGFDNEDTLYISLESGKSVRYDFGIGVWDTDDYRFLSLLASWIEKIELVTKHSTTSYTD